MPRAYVAADALVLPSEGETWGLVANEAMLCGLPCFVTDQVGCGPDMIKLNETGGVFSVGDVQALSTLMTNYAGDEKLRRTMSTYTSQRATERSTAAAVEATISALGSVVEMKKKKK